MRRPLPIALVATITLSLSCMGGCGRSEPTPQDLPEDPALRLAADKRERRLLKDARTILATHRNDLLEVSPYAGCGIFQAEHLLDALDMSRPHSQFGPVAIAAFAGLDASGQPYVCVHTLVPLREVSCFRLALSDESGRVGVIAIRLKQQYKSVEYIKLHFFRAELTPWASLRGRLQTQEVLWLDYDKSMPVPFPDATDDLACAVAVEDRRGRLSNFVPVIPYNASQKWGEYRP
jgi:hypothetical protein